MTRYLSLLTLALAMLPPPACAQHRLYACMRTSRSWVVGAPLLESGLMVRDASGWRLLGPRHPVMTAMAADPHDPATLYLAAGDGCIRVSDKAKTWRILTDERVTELRDIALDSTERGVIYIAHTHGVAVSRDAGRTWRDSTGTRRRRYTEAVRVDRASGSRLVAGGEDGIWLSEDAGTAWRRTGAAGFQVMRIEQSPHEPAEWLAVTMRGGLFRSRDGGRSFENLGDIGVGRNLYSIAYDPTTRGRIAVGGWGPGVQVSEDAGATWAARNHSLPRTDVWSVVFDPDLRGRLYASVHEEALFVSDNSGREWRRDGLPGSVCSRLVFVPEEKR